MIHRRYNFLVRNITSVYLQNVLFLTLRFESWTITVVYYWHNIYITSETQQHLLTVALISLSNKIFIICVPHFVSQILTPPRLMSCHCVKQTKSRCYKLFNTLVPGRCSKYFKSVNFSFRLQIEFLSTSCEIALMCMSRNQLMSQHWFM